MNAAHRKSRSGYRKAVVAGLSAAWVAGLTALAITATAAHAL